MRQNEKLLTRKQVAVFLPGAKGADSRGIDACMWVDRAAATIEALARDLRLALACMRDATPDCLIMRDEIRARWEGTGYLEER